MKCCALVASSFSVSATNLSIIKTSELHISICTFYLPTVVAKKRIPETKKHKNNHSLEIVS